jgi:hemerythrin-like domain-containing protein
MTAFVPLHAGPSVGFDQPFEMLRACHERVRRTVGLLVRLHAHLDVQGADASARQAAADVLRYFDLAGPLHHEDEERHVLPRLRAAGGEAAALADRLHADHRRMAIDWARVRADLQAVVAGEAAALDSSAERLARWQAFGSLHAEHVVAEEALAYPEAERRLGAAETAAMGDEMVGRRRRR